jgi:acyl-CoA thioester hydrolase
MAPKVSMLQQDSSLAIYSGTVETEWIDYNGHMNLAYYVLAFDHATDAFLDYLGLTGEFREHHHASTFAAEIRVHYLRELHEADQFQVMTQLLDFDEKRIHYFHRMYHAREGWLAASNELMSLYMDMSVRRVSAMPQVLLARLQALLDTQRHIPVPREVSRPMQVPAAGSRRKPTRS